MNGQTRKWRCGWREPVPPPSLTDIDRVGAEIKILEHAKTTQNLQALRDGAILQNGVYATAAIF
jgi:hypothetical protein